jgi:hypothetical protein
LRLLPIAALAFAACRATAGLTVRIDPPPPEPGAPADAQALRLEQAVREVAAADQLECRARRGQAPELLSCWPGALGSQTEFVRLHLTRAGTGYEIRVVESTSLFTRPRTLCRVQRQLTTAIDAQLGLPSAHPDPQHECAAGGGG